MGDGRGDAGQAFGCPLRAAKGRPAAVASLLFLSSLARRGIAPLVLFSLARRGIASLSLLSRPPPLDFRLPLYTLAPLCAW